MRQRMVAASGARPVARRRLRIVGTTLAAALLLGSGGATARPVVAVQDPPADLVAGAAAALDAGSSPSISGDGRFIAYLTERESILAAGTQGDDDSSDGDLDAFTELVPGTTVAVRDRADGSVFDAMPLAPGTRLGGVANPVLSGDGCVLVVHTELGLDLFRDNDGGARWDVYRTVLPHCGGTIGEWELVSTHADRASESRDDVDPSSPAAVSRAGEVIAYTHPADGLIGFDGLTSISVVDLTVVVGEAGRVVEVPGLPIDGPLTTYAYRGLDQPALSGDGRFVAFRSDALSANAVPTWADGPADGEPAVAQAYVWDRDELDPFLAVRAPARLADGSLPMAGSADPRLSRDGAEVAFTSADAGLVVEAGGRCEQQCVQQVFVHERDVDGNGRLDEPGRARTLLLSAVERDGEFVAASSPAVTPALSGDGHVVAFVSKAVNLSPLERPVGDGADSGHLWVSANGELERIDVRSVTGSPVAGVHAAPQLDDTGTTLVYDTLTASAPSGGSAPEAAPAADTLTATALPAVPDDDALDGDDEEGSSDDELSESPEAADDETVAADETGTDADRDDATGDGATGDDASADDASADDSASDDATGDGPTGDDPAGDDPTGDDATGDDPAGDDATGDDGDVVTLRSVGIATASPDLVMADVDFGTTVIGLESDEWYVNVVNNGRASFQPAMVESTDARFSINLDRSTCVLGVSVPPGGRCQVAVSFTPSSAGGASSTLTVAELGFNAASISARLSGTTGEPILRIDESGIDFEPTVVGQTSIELFVDVSNISPILPTRIGDVSIGGANPEEFDVTTNNCVDRPFNPRAHCSLGIVFSPTEIGRRTALIEVTTNEGQSTSVIVAGDGALAPELAVEPFDADGDRLLVQLSGYPPEQSVTIAVGRSGGRVTVTTDSSGAFVGLVTTPPDDVGAQPVTVEVDGQTVAVAAVDLPFEDDLPIGLPGFGLGG